MTDKQIDKMIVFLARGNNSYEKIHKAFPELSESEIRFCTIPSIGSAEKFFILEKSVGKPFQYHFSKEDTFRLTESGQNRLYRLQKEKRDSQRFYLTLTINVFILILTIIGLVSD